MRQAVQDAPHADALFKHGNTALAIRYSFGHGKYDNTPRQMVVASAESFIEEFLAIRATEKGQWWFAGPFCAAPDDDRHRTNSSMASAIGQPHRCKECAQPRQFIGLDVDRDLTPESFSMLVQILGEYLGLVYTTASHTPEKPRCRVILLLDRPLVRSDFKRVSAAVRELIDRRMGEAGFPSPGWDDGCDKPEQPLYAPMDTSQVYKLEGRPLQASELLPLESLPSAISAPSAALPMPPVAGQQGQATSDPWAIHALHSATVAIRNAPAGQRNDLLNREAYSIGGLVEAGRIDENFAINSLVDATVRAAWDDPAKNRGTIRAGIAAGRLEPRRDGLGDPIIFTMGTTVGAANDPAQVTSPTVLAQALARAVRPLTMEQLAKARLPHPHVFSNGHAGLFPVAEATIIGGGMREGKTTTLAGIIRAVILGRPVAGLPCAKPGRVMIYSAEDDPEQYGRLLLAMMEGESDEAERERLHAGYLVPDLGDPALESYRALVKLAQNRQPIPGPMVDAIIEAVRPMTQGEHPIEMIVFETISTLSQAEEDNAGLSVLAAVFKRVAKKLGVAVAATHHTNQAADREFAELDFSVRALRGGSALPSDTRQILLVVDLGSDAKPIPSKLLSGGKVMQDKRNWLRKFVTASPAETGGLTFSPRGGARISMLVPVNTSKLADPPPAFFEWLPTQYGPAVQQMTPRDEIAGLPWQQVVGTMYAESAAKRSKDGHVGVNKFCRELAEAAEKDEQERLLCVDAVRRLEARGTPATASGVAKVIGTGKDWPKGRLVRCVELGLMTCAKETVRGKGDKVFDVYRLTERARQEVVDDDAEVLIPEEGEDPKGGDQLVGELVRRSDHLPPFS